MQKSGRRHTYKPLWTALVAVLVLAATAVAGDGHGSNVHDGDGPLGLSKLPDSALKNQIVKLPPAAAAQALQTLGSMVIGEADVDHLGVDRGGGVFIWCEFRVPDGVAEADPVGGEPQVAGAAVPISQVPAYSSKPGAPSTLYLDFNGHVITGTAWNGTHSTLNALPYSRDTDFSTFSDDEQLQIYYIWLRIAEDFKAFNVNVTTAEPSSFNAQTGRLLFTRDEDADGLAMPSKGAGGVAYVNVWGRSDFVSRYSPALVYTENLGGGRNDYCAEAGTHEAGHNLGLSHDAATGVSYYGGHGSGETSWGPIMGTGYNRSVSQWSKGEYPNATNTQDDLSIINGKIGLAADDHGGSTGAATLLASSGGAFSGSGVIGLNSGLAKDLDYFAIDAGSGALSVTVTPFTSPVNYRGCNLDVKLELLNSGGSVIATANPDADVDATLTTEVNAGRYYLRISGDAEPAVDTDYGYTDYASHGQYALSGSVTSATPVAAAPTFSPNGGSFWPSVSVTLASSTPGATIRYTTDGSTPTAASPVYASPLNLTQTTTVRAYASASGYTSSSVSSASFSYSPPTVAAPSITPNGGSFWPTQDVTLSTSTSGASIYYTTDGSVPTAGSTLYSGPFTLSASATVRAMATRTNYLDSSVTSAGFTAVQPQVATPVINPSGGDFFPDVTVSITCATDGASIYYTLDGSTPTTSSALYVGAFTLGESATVRAFATYPSYLASGVDSQTYTYVVPLYSISGAVTGVDAPVNVSAGGQTVATTLQGSGPGATWVYTIDGLEPGTYTVTPSLSGYVFTPGSRQIVIGDASVSGADFAGTPEGGGGSYAISGEIFGVSQAVTVSAGGVSVQSVEQGKGKTRKWVYSIAGLANGTYPVTASLAGYTFSPDPATVTINGADRSGIDFTGAVDGGGGGGPWSITGQVNGVDQAVTVSFGSYSAQTSLQGRGKNARWTYSITGIPDGTSAQLSASLAGYSFSPAVFNLTLTGDLNGYDFNGTANAGPEAAAPVIESAWYSLSAYGQVRLLAEVSGADTIQWYVAGEPVKATLKLASGTYTATVVASSGGAQASTSIEVVVP